MVFGRLRRELERPIHPCGFSRSARRFRNISIAASPSIDSPRLGLRKPHFGVGRDGFALLKHPVVEVKLLPDDLEGLIENLIGTLVCTGASGQIDHALLFGLQVNHHGTLPVLFPYYTSSLPLPLPSINSIFPVFFSGGHRVVLPTFENPSSLALQ
jgi:hypothetical protein